MKNAEIMNMELSNLVTTCKKMNLLSLIKLSNHAYDLYYEKYHEMRRCLSILKSDDVGKLIKVQYDPIYKELKNELPIIWRKYEIIALEIGEKFLKQIGITDRLIFNNL